EDGIRDGHVTGVQTCALPIYQSYGASQKVDFFNVDRNDQAVVFISSLAELGFEPSNAGVDRFVSALTGAVARRIGELLGIRFEKIGRASCRERGVMPGIDGVV